MQKSLFALVLVAVLVPVPAGAFYTNDNFALDGVHPAPVSFAADDNGGFFGTTEGGHIFTQRPVENALGLRIHKFSVDEAFFYVSDRGAYKAHSDLAAISIYFSLV